MKSPAAFLVFVFSCSVALSNPCDEHVVAYNLNYANQKEDSAPRKLFNGNLSKFLTEHTSDDNRNLAYYLSSKLFHPQSNDDNVFDLSEVLGSGKPLSSDNEAVVAGHTLITLDPLKDEKSLKEIAKFLYIQVMTNADLKRASNNLNDLTDCPLWHIFNKSKH